MIQKLIHRPVLSIVISVFIVLLGSISLSKFPVTLFPNIAPPEVKVTVNYTGANAETVVKTALVPLERVINGVPHMKFITSDATNDGLGTIQVIFETGTDPDIAAIHVQNRVNQVIDELPTEVIKNGVVIEKEEKSPLLFIDLYSTDSLQEEKFLYNFADINILPELKRIKGVGFVDILGNSEYAMRIWLKPDKMLAYNVSTENVIQALQDENIEASPGKIGESSNKQKQSLEYVVRYTGKFTTEDQYANIPIKADEAGKILKIKDVADVEFETIKFDFKSKLNGRPCATIELKQLPGSNAQEIIKNVKEKLYELEKSIFLKDIKYSFSYDVSRFLDESISKVFKTLIEAFILVMIVIFIFLQNWRAVIIPMIAVPVSLIGTFAVIQMFDFSLNMVTLFALVMAIGIVIDNAIVVIEAVYEKMEKHHLSAEVATQQALKETSVAILSITLVMSAVFIPISFMKGPSGIFYRQFGLTMASAIILSGIVALTLTPALCVLFFKNFHQRSKIPPQNIFTRFFKFFNANYLRIENKYAKELKKIISKNIFIWIVLLLFSVGIGIFAFVVPSGFIPNEDQGIIYVSVTSPAGATLERTEEVIDEIQKQLQNLEEVESISTMAGYNIVSETIGAIYGTVLINLKPWKERNKTANDLISLINNKIKIINKAHIEVFPPAPVPGYGNASGFELRLLNKTGNNDYQEMQKVVDQFKYDLQLQPELDRIFSTFNSNFPTYTVHIDINKATQKGVTVKNALQTLQTLLGSSYASNFIRFGQMYKVMVQALPKYRALPKNLLELYVKNNKEKMVALSSFMTIEKTYNINQVTRYNMFPSAEFNGEGKTGISSGQMLNIIKQTGKKTLPRGYDIDWAGISKDEVDNNNEGIIIFLISLLFIYLILAGQYESFKLPFSVLASLPIGIFGAFLFLKIIGLENNIYAQIAMIMLIGLLGKNAILIVEYALQKQRHGYSPQKAAIEGALLRLRPILMTSFAFIGGLIPLLLTTGAGAIGNKTIGAAALGGMLFGTIFGVVIIPTLYVIFSKKVNKQQ